jgi:hypothetical protein
VAGAPGPLSAAEPGRWLEETDRDYANLCAALRWVADRGAAEPGLRLCLALFVYWWDRAAVSEGARYSGALRRWAIGAGCRRASSTSLGPRSAARRATFLSFSGLGTSRCCGSVVVSRSRPQPSRPGDPRPYHARAVGRGRWGGGMSASGRAGAPGRPPSGGPARPRRRQVGAPCRLERAAGWPDPADARAPVPHRVRVALQGGRRLSHRAAPRERERGRGTPATTTPAGPASSGPAPVPVRRRAPPSRRRTALTPPGHYGFRLGFGLVLSGLLSLVAAAYAMRHAGIHACYLLNPRVDGGRHLDYENETIIFPSDHY